MPWFYSPILRIRSHDRRRDESDADEARTLHDRNDTTDAAILRPLVTTDVNFREQFRVSRIRAETICLCLEPRCCTRQQLGRIHAGRVPIYFALAIRRVAHGQNDVFSLRSRRLERELWKVHFHRLNDHRTGDQEDEAESGFIERLREKDSGLADIWSDYGDKTAKSMYQQKRDLESMGLDTSHIDEIIKKYGFKPWGWYRIIAGILLLAYFNFYK